MSRQLHLDSQHTLADLLKSTLARSSHLAGRNLQIDVSADGIILSGRVSSWYQKQVAQETLRPFLGVTPFVNRLEVQPARG